MISIAREIVFHDRLRFAITVVSLGFTIVMTVYDLAMFYGVTSDSVALLDRAGAELWVSEEEHAHLNASSSLPEGVARRARALAGVSQACPLGISAGNLKIGDARQVQIVGIDPACTLFQPWDVVLGDSQGIRRNNSIIIDDLALRGLNQSSLGDEVELNGQELRLVAVTHNNKSFSSPFVYVNLDTFAELSGNPGMVSFVAVRLAPGADGDQVSQVLLHAASDLEIAPAQGFRSATINALIAHEQAKKEGRLKSLADLQEAIRYGAVKRLRPKFMTVATTFLGLVPRMWSIGTGSDVMKRIAAPMIGGIFSSFLLELLVYPAIYQIWKWNFEVKKKLIQPH